MKPKNKHQQIVEQWDFYFSDNKDASTALNLALIKVIPIEDMTNLARITIKMINPRPDGLCFDEENQTLKEIEMAIATQVKASNSAIHAAHYTGGGIRMIYFYCNDTDSFNDVVSDVMAGYPDYQYDVDFQKDEEWEVYFELFPTKRQIHSMGNRHLIEQLINLGVNLTNARLVEHTVFFKNKIDRKSFLKAAKKQGFTDSSQFYEKSLKVHPYALEISRVDKVDWTSIDAIVFQLLDLTDLHHGIYDGWAIFMSKDEIKQ